MEHSLYKQYSIEELETENFDFNELIKYFILHFKQENADYRKAILYTCETINKMPISMSKSIIGNDSFKYISNIVVNEYKYLPKRDIPIGVDLALRSKVTNPDKTLTILQSFYNTEGGVDHVYHLLFLAAQNPLEPTQYYKDTVKFFIIKFFSELTYNQIKRLFDGRNLYNKEVIIKNFEVLKNSSDLKGLCRLFILSYVYFPNKTQNLYSMITNSNSQENLTTKDKNFVYLLKNNILNKLNILSPFIKKIPKTTDKIKIAICISGQLRGYEKAFASWYDALSLNEVDYTIFVSTWEKVGAQEFSGMHLDRFLPDIVAQKLHKLCSAIGKRDFIKLFPNLANTINYSGLATFKKLSKTYDTDNIIILDDNLLSEKASNSERMYAQIENAYDMAVNSGEEFDLYLKIRPDKYIEKLKNGINWNLISEECKKNVLFTDFTPILRTHGLVEVGDQILIANKEVANIVFRPYRNFKYISKLGGCSSFPDEFQAHSLIGALCIVSNIRVKRIEGLMLVNKNLCNPSSLSNKELLLAIKADYKINKSSEIKEILSLFKETLQ